MESPVVVNGVNGATGAYLMAPLTMQQVSALARCEPVDADHLGELRWRHRHVTEASFGPRYGIDPKDVAQAGWGVVFSHDAEPSVREALGELLEHRRAQASAIDDRRYREYIGSDAYRPGESKQEFLARHDAGPGPADPDRVPYYLMLVGGPDHIPYEFQYQLDVQYAVGRLDLDSAEDYAAYGRAVVAAEGGSVRGAERRLALFATSNPNDAATALSTSELVLPLSRAIAERATNLRVDAPIVGDAATKPALSALLGARDPAALVFTATHGIGFPSGDPRQREHQGALVCQEWQGPGGPTRPVPSEHFLSADDVPDTADFSGVVTIHFACFSGGTPGVDGFVTADGGRLPLAPRPFTARLPKRLLSHRGGPALAVVGHVDRAWGYSFSWPGVGTQIEALVGSVLRLSDGHPLGSALEQVNERYAELATVLSQELEDVKYGKRSNDLLLASLWTAHNDARNFVILGDPAVRMRPQPDVARSHRADQTPERADVPTAVVSTGFGDAGRHAITADASEVYASDPRGHDSFDEDHPAREQMAEDMGELTRSMQAALEAVLGSLEVLEVVTSVVDDMSRSAYDHNSRRFTGSEPRIVTRLAIDGATDVVVARECSSEENPLWKLHLEMVDRARSARTELIQAVSSALSLLLDAAKLK